MNRLHVENSFGAEGEIWVKGPMNAVGYYNRPDLTAKAFDNDGYYHTVRQLFASARQ